MASRLVEGSSTDPVRDAFEGRIPQPTEHGPEDGAVCSEGMLSVAAQRTRPVVFSEMRLSAAAPNDVPAMYFLDVRVSECRQALSRHGRRAALGNPGGSFYQMMHRIEGFLVELRNPDAFVELCIL